MGFKAADAFDAHFCMGGRAVRCSGFRNTKITNPRGLPAPPPLTYHPWGLQALGQSKGRVLTTGSDNNTRHCWSFGPQNTPFGKICPKKRHFMKAQKKNPETTQKFFSILTPCYSRIPGLCTEIVSAVFTFLIAQLNLGDRSRTKPNLACSFCNGEKIPLSESHNKWHPPP